ncbi:MAG: hypothetical protein IKC40_05805, partial [Oscillospiraceae bacterium]|nr:hypothetical protein [Oscillospiraceae bacterium]
CYRCDIDWCNAMELLYNEQNHLHISEGILNGVSCSYLGSTDLMGFITMNLRDLKVTDITKVIVKNNYTLVIMTNKKYVFLIEDAQKAREIICRYTQ